jgi:hypothetical protein
VHVDESLTTVLYGTGIFTLDSRDSCSYCMDQHGYTERGTVGWADSWQNGGFR